MPHRRFSILNDPRFHLVYQTRQRFSDGPEVGELRLQRPGFQVLKDVKKKTPVYPGMLLAEHPSPGQGDLFSPAHGVVQEITGRHIIIKTNPPPKDAPEREPFELAASDLEGDDLLAALKKMGVSTQGFRQRCKTLIINCLNPDPGVTWAEPMLVTHVRNLTAGMQMHKRISRAEKIIMALPRGSRTAYKDVETAHIDPTYPNSLDQLVIKAVTGEENPADVGIVGLHALWGLGRVCRTGMPLTETVLSIGSYEHSGNYIVKDGTKIGDLLDFAQVPIKTNDTVIRGGPLRGESVDMLDRVVNRNTYGVFVVEAGTIPAMLGHSPCINCGACDMVCPARISPSILSRAAEFALYEKCRNEYISHCMDCGLCGYVCIARRPVLQYIRLAKHKLAEADASETPAELKI